MTQSDELKGTGNPFPVFMGPLQDVESLVGFATVDDERDIHIKIAKDTPFGKRIMEVLEGAPTIRNFSMTYLPADYPRRPLG